MPVQVWATWFPREGKPQSFIQGFPIEQLEISSRGRSPFFFRRENNSIDEDSCRGVLRFDGHTVSWDLRYHSTFRTTLSNKGWIGFSRTPHSDAVFSGRIVLDGHIFEGDPLGLGIQGHNCGYRHRGFWKWAHAYFSCVDGSPTTLEALVYDMPLGLVFRKAVLWHEGQSHVFRNLREAGIGSDGFGWTFQCHSKKGLVIEAAFDGSGPSIHRLPYTKTDCTGSFEVTNNSLAKAVVRLHRRGSPVEELETSAGAVLEMAGPFRR